MRKWLDENWFFAILIPLFIAASIVLMYLPKPIDAASVEPQATATPPPCIHMATADTIKVYYCEDINLFVNNLGFMAFEP